VIEKARKNKEKEMWIWENDDWKTKKRKD